MITDPPPPLALTGGATPGGQYFVVEVDVDANTMAFGGSLQSNVGLRDLLGGLPPDAMAMLGWVPNIVIEEAGFHFDPDPVGESFTVFVVAGIAGSSTSSANLFIATVPTPAGGPVNGQLTAATAPAPSVTAWVVGLGLTTSIDLGGTPLFGSLLSGIALQALGINYASHALPANAFTLPPPAPAHQPAFPEGLVLTLTIAGGGAERTFVLQPSTKAAPNASPKPPALLRGDAGPALVGDEPSDDQPVMQWFSVQKTIGPLTLGRLGLLTTDKQFGLGLDASVATSAFSVVLTGFTVTFPTDRIDLSAITIQLDGLALAFTSPSVAITGSLARREEAGITEYNGAVLIQVGQFGIAAVGSYASLHGSPSLFIYGMAKGAFGGPPAFFVTGLAAGFGFNRSLRLPAFDAVADHPFILASKTGADFTKALAMLTEGGWVPPSAGDYWLAAGIQFVSFELVKSFVLVIVQFGNDLVFALLGIAAIQLPQVGPTYAYAELTVDAVLRPLEGTFQLTAMLTPNSFLLDPACHLQGGFAVWVWFGDNEHAGDFVITLGGYHPLFDPPDWYPAIPRLGFDWNMSDTIHLSGGVYFALTPSCVMAGGSLALTFHEGDLRAWFTAHVDVLIFWKPFYFVAGIGVSIGVSYTLNLGSLHRTFKIELGVDVELWGPPVAGVAHVSWWVISFTVDINGGGRPDPPGRTLKDWDTFAKSFLPAEQSPEPSEHVLAAAPLTPLTPVPPTPICRPRAARGLLRTIEDDKVWVVAAAELQLATETVIPATEIVVGDPKQPDHHFTGPAAGVYPMGSVNLESRHLVSLDRVYPSRVERVDLSTWTWEPVAGSQPQSLWGRQNSGEAQLGADTVPVLNGSMGTPAPVELTGPGPISFAVLRYVDLPDRTLPLPTSPPIDGATTATPDPFTVVEDTVTAPAVVAGRDAVVAELNRLNIGAGLTGGDLTLLRDEVRVTFAAPPMIGPLGSTGPRPLAEPGAAPVRAVAAPSGRSRWTRPRVPAPTPALRRAFRRHHRPAAPGIIRALPAGEPAVGSGALRAAGRPQGSVFVAPDVTAVWELDPARAQGVELRGPARRLLAFDDQHHPLLDEVVEGAIELPEGTALVVVDEATAEAALAGWATGRHLRQVGPHLALGDGVLVRTQSPRPVPRARPRASASCGLATGAAVLASNVVAGHEHGDTAPGWVDTIVAAHLHGARVTLHRTGAATGSEAVLTLAAGGRPHPARMRRGVEPAGSQAHATGVHLVVDLAPVRDFAHLFVTPGDGWRLGGVSAFPHDSATELSRAPEPFTGPALLDQEPTVVVWR